MSLIISDLFERVLIQPLNKGANILYIVSGYATATMAMRHIEYAKSMQKNFSIRLIVGMGSQDGVEKKNHLAFTELQTAKFKADFQCNYIINRPPVHSKVYSWFKNEDPVSAYIGSANYTQNAFSSSMREILIPEDPGQCLDYYNSLIGETVNCGQANIKDFINIFESVLIEKKVDSEEISESQTAITTEQLNLPSVTLTLLDSKTGEVPSRSGLNWGQRPRREPNQAYINIPAEIGRSSFFPERYENFTVVTDDNKQIICVRAQDGGKGIQSTLNNSLLGLYFRYRLGLADGQYITLKDLLRYGRTDVTFYKIDNENYLMDFSIR